MSESDVTAERERQLHEALLGLLSAADRQTGLEEVLKLLIVLSGAQSASCVLHRVVADVPTPVAVEPSGIVMSVPCSPVEPEFDRGVDEATRFQFHNKREENRDMLILRFRKRPQEYDRLELIVSRAADALGRVRRFWDTTDLQDVMRDDIHNIIGACQMRLAYPLAQLERSSSNSDAHRHKVSELSRSVRWLQGELNLLMTSVCSRSNANLRDSIESIVRFWRPSASEVGFSIKCGEVAVDTRIQHHLLHLLHNAVGNAARHSGLLTDDSITAKVSVAQLEEQVVVTVEDNGVGFDPELVERGFGLFRMEELCRHLELSGHKASLEIDSEAGLGTRVTITISTADERS